MRVQSVEVRAVRMPMAGGQRNARRTWTHKPMLFCFVTLDNGAMGVGEGWTSYASSRALQATIEDDVVPLVVGRTLDDLQDLNRQVRDSCVMSGRYGISAVALSAVEMALWDLRAQAQDLPLWQLLGGVSNQVPVYASGGLYGPRKSPSDLGEELAGYVAGGHTRVKLKIGGASLGEDVARVVAARQAVGPNIALFVDAHYTLREAEALAFAEKTAALDLGWLEAPILPDDWQGHRRLAEACPLPLCGNETLPWRTSFQALAEAGVHYLMPDLSACGGIEETMAVGDLAQVHGGKLTLHSSSSVVLFLASLHVGAAHPATHTVEHHQMHTWFNEVAGIGLHNVSNGLFTLPDRPGLGINARELAKALKQLD
ncbi:MAG: mandelate racemase/muconate lactonizing enzyme family protein [Rhizobiales bacterium]|nr:mandelate racemase/muconate lactonizing enzyme family protein [Hyphomicrobiales bacterium]MBO6697483.1 mandelate racemase/muconate lactonizing enzyme family protein [Hyphomicrobiales bacterium]MBO6736262.1 mandelate racemase/muconate lactonizing enzyme family protein [Hyphomicrobiales bacterium]MBO6912732.1 mandelate racemase/muconate lactonizing enzyme family protein [Hyphomicrobiales bacterium]MBO6953901.1 mandelate racemase/muconate lactonizing enzyme family protein [Hyphomicrobiales bact